MAHDAFISYSSKDKATADAACAALEARGVRCWIAPRDVLPGHNWAASIIKAISESKVMVLVYSAHANASPRVQEEVERAASKNVVIVPFRVQDVPMTEAMELFLSTRHWLDAFPPPAEKYFDRLTDTVLRLLSPADKGKAAPNEPGPSPTPRIVPPARPARRRVPLAVVATLLLLLLGAAAAGWWWHVHGTRDELVTTRPDGGGKTDVPSEEIASRDAARRVAQLLAAAKANDSPDKAAKALASLNELLALEPTHSEALQLKRKISAYRRVLTNTLGMRFVEVKPGEFLMGTPAGELWREEDEILHRVKLTKPFMMGVHEVTRGQFAAFVKDTGHQTEAETSGGRYVYDGKEVKHDAAGSWQNPGFAQDDNHPVVGVSWNDAVDFAQWLSRKEGKTYRLPTEAEWEYACRAGTQTAYPWGDDPDGGKGWANAADLTGKRQFPGWTTFNWADGFVYTAPVGQFHPNAYSLHDMTGNVWEWCQDWYGAYSAGDVTNPTGPVSPPVPDRALRVLRGGAWSINPRYCRAGYRLKHSAGYQLNYVGFRLCLDF